MATEAVPEEIPSNCNMVTKAVLNTMPNNCDIATELVAKEIENDHRAYQIVYQMGSQETVKITTRR